MDNESKKPCAPVEEEGRDYDALGLFRREGDNETLMAAMGLWEFLPAWMAAIWICAAVCVYVIARWGPRGMLRWYPWYAIAI